MINYTCSGITVDKSKIISGSARPVMIRQKICNLDYLVSITRGNKEKINGLLTVFLEETSEELSALTGAIKKSNYTIICDILHKLTSSFSIMGISSLGPLIKEMKDLSTLASGIKKINLLNQRVNIIFLQATEEMNAIQFNV
jgi:HPt (histidine-containing phosphotransfer) domain-containing protein